MINRFENGQVELEFGYGDIIVGPLLASDQGIHLLFTQSNSHYDIGEYTEDEQDNEPDVIMTFDNPDSIDVVIKGLQRAKEAMVKNKE